MFLQLSLGLCQGQPTANWLLQTCKGEEDRQLEPGGLEAPKVGEPLAQVALHLRPSCWLA